jgi:hypothetical protein
MTAIAEGASQQSFEGSTSTTVSAHCTKILRCVERRTVDARYNRSRLCELKVQSKNTAVRGEAEDKAVLCNRVMHWRWCDGLEPKFMELQSCLANRERSYHIGVCVSRLCRLPSFLLFTHPKKSKVYYHGLPAAAISRVLTAFLSLSTIQCLSHSPARI